MLTVLHAADFHLDAPFRSLPDGEARERRGEQRKMLEDLRDLALERRVDLVLLAGDLFDGQETYPETLDLLARTLGEMGAPVVIAPGNHDFWGDKSPYALRPWPENVHIFRRETVERLDFPQLGVRVYGCAFTSPFREDDPLGGFHAEREAGWLDLGVFHGEVAPAGRYGPISPASLAGSGLAYAALGHIHQRPAVRESGPTPWAYPGSPMGRSFDETGPHGCLLVQIDGDGRVEPTFQPLPGSRYMKFTLDVTHRDPAAALLETLDGDLGEDYVRIVFTGESEGLDLPALRALGAGRSRLLELRDETVVPLDLWARAGEETLTGHFLREMKERLEGAENPAERRRVELAARYGLAALEGREEPQ